jgi:hypothetical protein
VAIALLVTACGVTPARPGPIGSPSPTVGGSQVAGPSAVPADPSGVEPGSTIRDYVRDLDGQDVAAAESLLAPQHVRTLLGRPDGWLTTSVTITDLSLGAPETRDGRGTAADGYAQVVFVPARLTLTRKTSDERLTWGFLLARNSMVSRWIIVDDGPA